MTTKLILRTCDKNGRSYNDFQEIVEKLIKDDFAVEHKDYKFETVVVNWEKK